jgi:DNA polymerase-3 subunit delta
VSSGGLILAEATPESDLMGMLISVPLFTEYQVVLVRPKTLDAPTVQTLTAYLADQSPSTVVVVAIAKAPAELSKAVKAAGGQVTDTSPRRAADTVRDLVANAPVVLDGAARAMVVEHAGEEVGQVPSLLATLTAAYGAGARLGVSEVGPHLGDAGGVPPWDLTDAIDNRDPAKALRALHRLLRDRVPIVVLASIHNHVERLFRLALLGIRDEKLAAVELGVKGSTYPVKKALSMLPRWGDTTAAMQLVVAAGDGVRGGSAQSDIAILQILVARLAARPR